MSTNGNGRPAGNGATDPLLNWQQTDHRVTRAAVDALVASVRPDDRPPAWVGRPTNETEFTAALILMAPRVGFDLKVRWDGDQAHFNLRVKGVAA